MLMVTTTMGMVNGVHSNTSSDGPVLSLVLKFVKGAASLKQGLVSPASTGDDTDHGSGGAYDIRRVKQVVYQRWSSWRLRAA